MTIGTFIKKTNLGTLEEVEKVEAIAFYMLKLENITEFDIKIVSEKLSANGFGKPNASRLKTKLKSSRSFVKGAQEGLFRLHTSVVRKQEQSFPFLDEITDHIETINSILPESLLGDTRGYIKKLAVQINASYENNICDGCAVLMRRLLEVLLIHGYLAKGREQEIKDSVTGAYKNLTTIIDYTISKKVLPIQKDTKEVLHDFRELGNFSAHGITYNCRKDEITKVARKYRVAIEDLLYAADLKK